MLLSIFLCLQIVFSSSDCITGNCQNGNGKKRYNDRSIYVGQFKDGLRHGIGRLSFSNGDIYEGTWSKGYQHGKGELRFGNGDLYQGGFFKNQFHGQGVYYFSDGSKYDGDWVYHKKHGKGTFTYRDGEYYKGDFSKDNMEGKGGFYSLDGTVHFGEWRNNQRNGNGIIHYADGTKEKGFWKNDQKTTQSFKTVNNPKHTIVDKEKKQKYWKNCNDLFCHDEQGKYIYKDGSTWKGNMKDGVPHGFGSLQYKNGNLYVGQFINHMPNGEGSLEFYKGKTIEGLWKDGLPVERRKINRNTITKDNSNDVKIYAVVIGISSYPHLQSLKYSDDDAYQIYAFLRSPQGGAIQDNQIKLLIDEAATKENILAAFNEVANKADSNDVIFVYYSGHGLEGKFLPIDFNGYSNYLAHKQITHILDKSDAKHKICIADACYSGSLLASRAPNLKNDLQAYYNKLDTSEGGTAFIMSSKKKEISLEAHGLRQGVFSHYILRGLNGEADKNQDEWITVEELFGFVESGVKHFTQGIQTPIIFGDFDTKIPIGLVYK